jgi:hypothetical protein
MYNKHIINTEMEPSPNPKCSRCKCYWVPDDTDIKTSGLFCKTCKKCRNIDKNNRDKNKCEHNREKSRCKECKGGSICEHNKIKSTCKECKGGSICEHNKIKSKCKECKGGSICEHNREKSKCKECKGSSICEHNKIKSTCKECKGCSICEHNKRKSYCKECKGGSICEHNREKSKCKECSFNLYLVNLQRNQIRRCFNNSKLDKFKHSIEYLGCNIDTFLNHINKKIEYYNTFLATDKLMSLNNIHIDHIKPVSKFNLDDEDDFLNCCNYTNLQPLLIVDNLEKSNKWNEENEKYWNDNIINNDEYKEIYQIF